MATNKDFVKTLFTTHVGPKFPAAKERFLSHFDARYGLIERTRTTIGKNEKGDIAGSSPLEYMLTVMGLKPLSIEHNLWELRHLLLDIPRSGGLVALEEADLDFIYRRVVRTISKDSKVAGRIAVSDLIAVTNFFVVFDPVLVAPILSCSMNRKIMPEAVKKALKEYLKDVDRSLAVPHDLMGYPQPLSLESPYVLKTENHGGLFHRRQIYSYSTNTSCKLSEPKDPLVLESLFARAMAAALIEHIRRMPDTIVSSSKIFDSVTDPTGSDFHAREVVTIERNAQRWHIESTKSLGPQLF